MSKLSDRLTVIADEIRPGETVADIGTDHGLLPIFLYESGRSPRVILCDVNRGPLEKARGNIISRLGAEVLWEPAQFGESAAESAEAAEPRKPAAQPGRAAESAGLVLRLGSGLRPLQSGEVDDVVIAGMGGSLMAEILGENLPHSRSFSKLILQPRNAAAKLRWWLFQNGFEIAAEHLVVERKYICEVITVRPGDSAGSAGSAGCADGAIPFPESGFGTAADETPEAFMDLEISPLLYESRDPLLVPFLKNKIRIEENVVKYVSEGSGQGINHSRIAAAEKRLAALRERLKKAETLR